MSEAWSSPLHDLGSSFEHSSDTAQRSDSELCAQIRQSSPNSPAGRAAFGELYARHRLPALHVALRLNRDRSRAEDSVSEAFAKIWQAWGNGNGPDDSFKPYLMAAVRSESYRRKATTRATTAVEPDVLSFLAGQELLDYADEVAERDQLGRAFKTLPDSWQSAITMIDIDGVPVSAAAESMELSSNSFSSLLRRAREGLRLAYLQEHVEPSRPECSDYAANLARYVRGQLGQRRIESLEEHLSWCAQCGSQAVRLRGLNTTFQAWMTPAVIAAALITIEYFPTSAVPTADGSMWNLVLGSPSGEGTGAGTNIGSWASPAPADITAGVGASATGASLGGLAGGTATMKVALACIAAAATIIATSAGIVAMQNDSAPQPASASGDSAVPATASTPITESGRDDGVPQPRPSAARSKNHGPRNDRPSAQASPHDPSSLEKPVGVPSAESEQPPQSAGADDQVADSKEPRPEPSATPLPQPGSDSDSAADRPQESPADAEEPTPPSKEVVDARDSKATSETDSDGRPNGDDGEAPAEKPDSDGEPSPGDEPESNEDDSGSGEESPSPSEQPNPGEKEPGSDDTTTGSNDEDEGIHCHDFGRWHYCH
ncbi:sigma-70 family RNA polymerase sigma factor [Brevibacterium aurantiacum]|uniref:Sigma-70 family RNA polymerase sigma factor n=1 Tax=Brevibacterium aurantiacum TaxID=273384 RepID=A0A556C8Z7_BREAU|nr:sigma-70 family RNA polymerase sigma factor [Brevibacterium aurantiacum]TSI13917.1 sigma-70 family RNA polymerase sigma factor [Brevibacterium aurantiacum]